MIVEHLRNGQVDYELDKCDELREPPLPVTVRFLDEWHDAERHGWAAKPKGIERRLEGSWAVCDRSRPGSRLSS